jgi:hypothetical protein
VDFYWLQALRAILIKVAEIPIKVFTLPAIAIVGFYFFGMSFWYVPLFNNFSSRALKSNLSAPTLFFTILSSNV